MLKKIFLLFIVCSLIFCFTGCNNQNYTKPEYTGDGGNIAVITVRGYDEPIRVQLCPEYAPYTVANFKINAEAGVYNGTTFHRVIKNFMIQGGNPATAGKELTDNIIGEFSKNGIDNTLKHERGVLSMARSDDYNSASSQFFICHQTEGCSHLDGLYAAFGYVISGMETVDIIAGVTTDYNNRPIIDVVIESVVLE